MKILVLTKRQYMGKDLLDDRFGRFWELPLALSRSGHQVHGIALSYRPRREESFASSPQDPAGATWYSVNLLSRPFLRRHPYFSLAERILSTFQPDIIWSCSDAFHAILGERLSAHTSAKHVIDLYDNFESYPASKIPAVRLMLRRALSAADGITCVSSPLAEFIRDRHARSASVLVLENAIRKDLFQPMNRSTCRESLQLQQEWKVIGTAGSLSLTRDMATLYRAFEELADQDPDLHLALAGPRPWRIRIPRHERIHDFGVLPLERVPLLINSLDVGIVCNRDSSFGRFSFPQRAREMIACGVPVIGADVGGMRSILRDHPDCIFPPENAASLANAIRKQLQRPTPIAGPIPDWTESAAILERFFMTIRRNVYETHRAS